MGYIHNDVNIGNIIYDNDFKKFKLIDYEHLKKIGESKSNTKIQRNVLFTTQKVLGKDSSISVDFYALGIVLKEILYVEDIYLLKTGMTKAPTLNNSKLSISILKNRIEIEEIINRLISHNNETSNDFVTKVILRLNEI